MSVRQRFFGLLTGRGIDSTKFTTDIVSTFRRRLPRDFSQKDINKILSVNQSHSSTLLLHDPKLWKLLKSNNKSLKREKKLGNSKYGAVNYFRSHILGSRKEFDLPDYVILGLIYPNYVTDRYSNNRKESLINIGSMLLEICCAAYSMKFFSSHNQDSASFVNGYDFDNLNDIKYQEHSIEPNTTPFKEAHPSSHIFLKRHILDTFLDSGGWTNSLIFDFEPHKATKTAQALDLLNATIGTIIITSGKKAAELFIKTQVIEAEHGLLKLSVYN